MSYALHELDEETDVGAYQAYLRAQPDDDLLDISQHLDPDRYPARLDAAQREMRRRHVLHAPVYTTEEYIIRYAALFAFALAAVTLALTLLLTPPEAAGPSWPLGIPENMPVLLVARLYAVAVLRGVVGWSVHLGLYDLTLLFLAHWAVTRGPRLLRHQARADVWRLTLLAGFTLMAAVLLATVPVSSVPDLFSSPVGLARALSLFNPFG